METERGDRKKKVKRERERERKKKERTNEREREKERKKERQRGRRVKVTISPCKKIIFECDKQTLWIWVRRQYVVLRPERASEQRKKKFK